MMTESWRFPLHGLDQWALNGLCGKHWWPSSSSLRTHRETILSAHCPAELRWSSGMLTCSEKKSMHFSWWTWQLHSSDATMSILCAQLGVRPWARTPLMPRSMEQKGDIMKVKKIKHYIHLTAPLTNSITALRIKLKVPIMFESLSGVMQMSTN